MKSKKLIIMLVSSIVLISLHAKEEKKADLTLFVNPKEVSSEFLRAWDFAQNVSEDAHFLELAAKIKRIQTCRDCSTAEKRLFITLFNNPVINLFNDFSLMDKIFVDNLKKYKNYGEVCDVGDIKKCLSGLTKIVLWKMLVEALKNNRKEVVELLIDAGANIQGGSGGTQLIEATKNNYKEIVQLLIDKGADVNFKAYNGDTALKIATQKGYKEIVEMLKKAGAK